jgi:DNA-3-methyladenine glycosylase II
MSGIIATEADIAAGLAALARSCPTMARIIPLAGAVPLRRSEPGFRGLVRIIVGQQVSVASAAAIWSRLIATIAPLEAWRVAVATDDEMRTAGLSRPKQRALRAVAKAALSGALPLERLAEMEANELRRNLTAVTGVGPWTADVFALFCVGHADAFAAGDLALQEAARVAFGLPHRPTAAELEQLALRWRPHRGVAARALWAYYAALKRHEGLPA